MNHQNEQITLAPLPQLIFTYSKDLARSLVKYLLLKDRRNRKKVASSYDGGAWQKTRESKSWLNYTNVKGYVVGSDNRKRLVKLDSKCMLVNTDVYYRLRVERLSALMKKYADDVEVLTELGCGYGFNIFSLMADDHWKHISGFDISENAISSAKEISSHFGLESRTRFDMIDLTNSNDGNFSHIQDQVVYTYFCLEQIPYDVETVVNNIIAAKPKRVINIEPTTEFLKLWKPLDLLNYLYVKSMDYQTRLFGVLEKMQAEGKVRIIDKYRLDFAPTIHNDGFVIVWEPVE